jgi:RNA polymerase sigma-70 factor (ECF subfamily)
MRKDRSSQKQLFDKYFSDMLSICLRYAKDEDDAKEICQKGFIKVFGKFEMFNGEGTLRGWIQSIMIRTAIDHYRRQQRENRSVVTELDDWDEPEEATIEADLAAEEIMKVVQQLPHMQRAVFNLFALEGYSHKEIAEELHLTEGTSKWYLCEARKSLKKMLAPVYSAKVREYAA